MTQNDNTKNYASIYKKFTYKKQVMDLKTVLEDLSLRTSPDWSLHAYSLTQLNTFYKEVKS